MRHLSPPFIGCVLIGAAFLSLASVRSANRLPAAPPPGSNDPVSIAELIGLGALAPDGTSVPETGADDCSFLVTTTDDSVPGSLRSAIRCANATPGVDTIIVPPGVYRLTSSGTNED